MVRPVASGGRLQEYFGNTEDTYSCIHLRSLLIDAYPSSENQCLLVLGALGALGLGCLQSLLLLPYGLESPCPFGLLEHREAGASTSLNPFLTLLHPPNLLLQLKRQLLVYPLSPVKAFVSQKSAVNDFPESERILGIW